MLMWRLLPDIIIGCNPERSFLKCKDNPELKA